MENRIKVVLAEKGISNKWLAEKLEKDQATVSKWCTNKSQPNLEAFCKIAEVLNVSMDDLIKKEITE